MKTNHSITLPLEQAKLWYDITHTLGIQVFAYGIGDVRQIVTVCSPEDRKAAWELFREEWNRLISP